MPKQPPVARGSLALLNSAEVSTDIFSAVMEYIAAGDSIIPLRGNERGKDYQDGKRPAYPWINAQHHAADEQQAIEWFKVQGFTAVGLVLGSVNKKAVLEFDDLAQQAAFEQRLSHLTNTRQHISGKRRGKHFIYRLPPELENVRSHNVERVGEFKANGQYVVAPPTTIKGYSWEVIDDSEPLTLTKGDYEAILAFLGVDEKPTQLDDGAPLVMLPQPISADGLIEIYHEQRQTIGRNRSLWNTARKARAARWPLEETVAALIAIYVNDTPPPGHAHETAQQRAIAGQKTIASAYDSRYNVQAGEYQARNTGLPNSAREHLLQLKTAKGEPNPVNYARVLDMLYMTGLEPGDRFTERAAIDCGKAVGIGDKTVAAALKWLEKIQPLITVLRTGDNVADAPIASLSIQDNQNQLTSKVPIYTEGATMQCIVWRNFRPELKRGVKSKTYTLPDVVEICYVLGVKVTPGDSLELSDLISTKTYRAAMQRALVARKPGIAMGRAWQAKRLGVSVRQAYKYDKPAGIVGTPNEKVTPLTFQNLDSMVSGEAETEFTKFLRIEGTNCPLRKGIAISALTQGKRVEFVQRLSNTYRIAETAHDDPSLALGRELGAEIKPPQKTAKRGQKTISTPVHTSETRCADHARQHRQNFRGMSKIAVNPAMVGTNEKVQK